jgi:hypothetical protein
MNDHPCCTRRHGRMHVLPREKLKQVECTSHAYLFQLAYQPWYGCCHHRFWKSAGKCNGLPYLANNSRGISNIDAVVVELIRRQHSFVWSSMFVGMLAGRTSTPPLDRPTPQILIWTTAATLPNDAVRSYARLTCRTGARHDSLNYSRQAGACHAKSSSSHVADFDNPNSGEHSIFRTPSTFKQAFRAQ